MSRMPESGNVALVGALLVNEQLSDRRKDLLVVLACAGKPVTCKSLAQELGVSDRTIRKDLVSLKAWAEQNAAVLEVKPRIGVRLSVPAEMKEAIMQGVPRSGRIAFSRSPRKGSRLPLVLWALLAYNDRSVPLDVLAAELGISSSTLRKQISSARKWLEDRGVDLASQRKGAVTLHCSEWSRRAALCEIAQLVGDDEYESLLEHVEAVLQRVESPELPGLRGSSFYSVACYLSIALLRAKHGHPIEARGFPWLHLLHEFEPLVSAVKGLGRALSISIDDNESAAFCTYVLGSSSQNPGTGAPAGPVTSVRVGEGLVADGRASAEILVILVGNSYGVDLLRDEELLQDLGAHLSLALSRMMTGTATYNPFKKDLEASYPKLYDYTARACRAIQRLIGLPFSDDEIVYVAMYMGAALERRARRTVTCLIVCPSGMGVARFLSERVMAEFPSIHVKALVPVPGLAEALSQSPVDLVLSPIKIDAQLPGGIEVIVVDPMLSACDKAVLSEALGQMETSSGSQLAKEQAVAVSARSMREARAICQMVREALGIRVPPTTGKALAIHLEFARKRLQRGQVLSQPVAEFKAGYPELFVEVRTVLEALKLFPQCPVPEAEVVPVMLYFVTQ